MINMLCYANAFDITSVFFIIAIVLLLIMSAFFSASEIAFSSANYIRIKSYAEKDKKGSRKALYIIDHFENALTAILVGNNFVNILSTTLCAYLFGKFILNPVLYNILNTIVMTVIILIFGEILPKAYSKNNPEKIALKLAPILFVVIKATLVFCLPFNLLQKCFAKKQKINDSPTITEDELEDIVETMEDEGVLDKQNADIIFGALKFNDVVAKDIMTPRVDVICASINSNIEEIKELFLKYQYSRLPIYKKSKDNIIGVLNQKDFFSALISKNNIVLNDMISPVLFVSKMAKINNVMRLMQKEKKHLAVVSDEYGGTSGIITMEDCFEEVFGEVYDEHDDSVLTILKLEENKFLVNAEISVESLFEYLHIETMPKNKYETIASFLSEINKKLPQEGVEITYKTIDEILDKESNFIKKEIVLCFKLTKVENRRIKEVELTKIS